MASPNQYNFPTRTSYGIALCRYNANMVPEIIMVKKRLSYNFCAFVMGKYRKNDVSDLMLLFNGMTLQEKIDIISLDFQLLWTKLWAMPISSNSLNSYSGRALNSFSEYKMSPHMQIIKKKYSYNYSPLFNPSTITTTTTTDKSDSSTSKTSSANFADHLEKQSFSEHAKSTTDSFANYKSTTYAKRTWLRQPSTAQQQMISVPESPGANKKSKSFDNMRFYNSYIKNRNKFEMLIADGGKKLRSMLNRSQNAMVIWEIPKGKQEYNEYELETAMREFYEETGICQDYYDILWEMQPMVEYYTDSENTYCNKYFIAVIKNEFVHPSWTPKVYFNIKERHNEIECAKWISINELKYIHMYPKHKKRLIKFVKMIFKFLKCALNKL